MKNNARVPPQRRPDNILDLRPTAKELRVFVAYGVADGTGVFSAPAVPVAAGVLCAGVVVMQLGVGVGVLVPEAAVSVVVGVPVPGTDVGVGVQGWAVTVPVAMLVAPELTLGAAAGVLVVKEEGVSLAIADGLVVASLVIFGSAVNVPVPDVDGVLVPSADGVSVPPDNAPPMGARVGALAGVDVPALGAQAAAAATSIRTAPTISNFLMTGFLLFCKPAYAHDPLKFR